ncbi:hypothetical protein tb265_30600 [Gemmatimonadetes bacterium T265]|nr:hypothetical protein tb265_30600 [Gemmatimonadetes bacterium T265]
MRRRADGGKTSSRPEPARTPLEPPPTMSRHLPVPPATFAIHGLCAAALAAALAGCSSDSTAPPTTSLVGNYALTTVNGSALPYTDGSGDKIVGGSLQVNGNSTYTAVQQSVPAGGGTEVDSATSNWSGNSRAAQFSNGINSVNYQGSLNGSVLTLAGGGLTWAYQKQ